MKNKNFKLAREAAFLLGILVVIFLSYYIGGEEFFKSPSSKSDTTIHIKSEDTLIDVKGKKVLFIGDSHTTYDHGWQDRISERTGMISTNTAVGGKRTSWMLDVMKERKQWLSKYDYCIIWGGANDMASMIDPKDAVRNVQSMVDLCNLNGVKAVVMTGFNPKTCLDVSGKGEAWQPYPERYEVFQKMLQDSIKGAKVIKSHFISRKERDCGDFCCHMNASGHIKMADSMISRLRFKTIK